MKLRLSTLVLALVVSLLGASAHAERLPGQLPGAGKIIAKIKFRGNRKAEDDAIRANLYSQAGEKLTIEHLRADIHAIWKMPYFDDVQVEEDEDGKGRVILTFVVREKPSIRKIYVAGSRELGLDKINEVLDLKKDTIYDPTKVKRNVEKVHDLYVEKGYYLAEVTSDIKRIDNTHVDVYFIVDEHAKVEVRRITFLGNRALPTSELKRVMQTQEGGWLSFLTSSGTYKEETFERDLLIITSYYYDKGYINAKLGKPVVEISNDKRYLYLTLSVDEGEQFRVGKIDFRGDLLIDKKEYYKRMTVREGDTFNRSKLVQDITHLNDLYKDAGYANVNIQPLTAIDVNTRTVDVTFEAQKGNLVYFNRIQIRGNTKTRDKVIRREMRVYEGELFNQTRLDRSKRLITQLGFFEHVELSTHAVENDPDRIDVTIEVAERATGTFQIGAGFSSVENFIGQAQVSQNNLFGRGTSLQLQAQISSIRQLFSLRYVDPYFLDTRLTFAFNVYNSLLYYPSFNRTARGGEITFGYLLGDYTRVFGTYKLEDVQVKENANGITVGGFAPSSQVAPGTISNLFRSGVTSSIRLSLNYDTRDDRMFPKHGMFHSLSVEFADPIIASQSVFTRVSGFLRFYKPIWGPFIFRVNAEGGLVISRSPQGVPVYERYFIGGINSIRGFQLYSLGPRVNTLSGVDPSAFLTQFNVGGNLQLVLNTEVEFPIIAAVNIRGVIFFDAGNAYNVESRYCPARSAVSNIPQVFSPCNSYPTFTNLRYSVGFGFRWQSPIGPLRFEWGIPLNRQHGENHIVFQFTIGNFF
ncbi:MAG: outer membrane protein assembly factor BamA [Polyangia bacterium]